MEWCNLHSVIDQIYVEPNNAGDARFLIESGVESYRNRTTGESQNNTQIGMCARLVLCGVSPDTKTRRSAKVVL